ncbi:MAG: peptidylprolyl isomerase [Myxococcota bacterium]
MKPSVVSRPLSVLVLLGCAEEPKVEAPPAPAPTEATATTPAEPAPAMPRVPTRTTTRAAASHVLVAYAGAVNALPNVSRTREEARARAEEARTKALAGQDFAAVAKAYSDDSTGPRGGYLGGFDDGTMVKPFEDAVKALEVGQIGPVVETPFGFHVIKREPLAELRAGHLVVSWAGAQSAPAGVSRTKEEARARAEEAVAKIKAGTDWAEVVRAYSDGPLKEDGGDLGWFGRNQLAPQLDAAAFELAPGDVSGIVETPRGFHVMKRIE